MTIFERPPAAPSELGYRVTIERAPLIASPEVPIEDELEPEPEPEPTEKPVEQPTP